MGMKGAAEHRDQAIGVRRHAQFFRYLFCTVNGPTTIAQMAYDADVTEHTMRSWVEQYEVLGMVRVERDPADARRMVVHSNYTMTKKPRLADATRRVPSAPATPEPGPLRLTASDWAGAQGLNNKQRNPN